MDDGQTVADVGLAPFVGRTFVAHVPTVKGIDAATLEGIGAPAGLERLLLRTDNSDSGDSYHRPFHEDYVALTRTGAEWIVERGLLLVGIDYLSIQRFRDSTATHRTLLGGGVCILEGLDLSDVAVGEYQLVCLPLALVGAEAAPARAVLFPWKAARA